MWSAVARSTERQHSRSRRKSPGRNSEHPNRRLPRRPEPSCSGASLTALIAIFERTVLRGDPHHWLAIGRHEKKLVPMLLQSKLRGRMTQRRSDARVVARLESGKTSAQYRDPDQLLLASHNDTGQKSANLTSHFHSLHHPENLRCDVRSIELLVFDSTSVDHGDSRTRVNAKIRQ